MTHLPDWASDKNINIEPGTRAMWVVIQITASTFRTGQQEAMCPQR